MSFCRDLCSGVVGNVRNCMATPLTKKKVVTCCGVITVFILFIIIIFLSTPSSNQYNPPGSEALENVPFIIGNLDIHDYLTPYYNATNYNYRKFFKDNSHLGAQVLTTSVDCESQFKDAVEQTIDQLDFICRLVSASKEMKLTKTTWEIINNKKDGVMSMLLSLGGGHSIDTRTSLIRLYYQFGVRIITIASPDCSNPWARSISGDKDNITIYGKDFLKGVVNEMNRLGIAIDLAGSDAHYQETVINLSQAPVMMRATALASRKSNPFNINDTILTTLKNKGGLLMVSMDCSLFSNLTNCTMEEFKELVKDSKNKLGSNNIGIGGLIDSKGKAPSDLNFKTFFDQLKNEGWTMEQLEGLAGYNFINFFQQVEKVAHSKRSLKAEETFYDISKLPDSDRVCYTEKTLRPTAGPTENSPIVSPTSSKEPLPSMTTALSSTSPPTEKTSTSTSTPQESPKSSH